MRIARNNVPGVIYHLIWRFVDREWFFESDEEREFYLLLLGRAMTESDWLCFSYALMSNHIHLGVRAGLSPLDSWVRRVNSPFARWMNERRGRLGPIFADRAKDIAVVPERVCDLIAYIHNNPVRAGVALQASDSRWTSHSAYVGITSCPAWLDVEFGLARSGFQDPQQLDQWVRTQNKSIDDPDLAAFRRKIRRRGALEVSAPSHSPVVVPIVARPYAHIRPDPTRMVEMVCELLGVSKAFLGSRTRIPEATRARRILVRAARAAGLINSEIAASIGVSDQAVSRLARGTVGTTEVQLAGLVVERLRVELPDLRGQVESVPRLSSDVARLETTS